MLIREHGWRWDDRLAWGQSWSGAADEVWSNEEWQRQVDPDNVGNFAKRLRWGGLTSQQAGALLAGSPSEAVGDNWWPLLERLRDACRASCVDTENDAPSLPQGSDALPFAHLLWPMVEVAAADLVGSVDPVALGRLTPAAADDLRLALVSRLSGLARQALFDDFTRDRPAGRSLMLRLGVLPGEAPSSREQYLAYCRDNRADGLDRVLAKYPVLGRVLSVACSQWVTTSRELIERIERDRVALYETYAIAADLPVGRVTTSLSDPHRGGRSVAIVRFGEARDDADERTPAPAVVYKPKSVHIELLYNELVGELLGAVAADARPPVVNLLGDRDEYGYASLVEHEPCPVEQLGTFYRSAGRLLAILHVLGATDCHYENLIAHGTDLALIDAETLFEGRSHDFLDDGSAVRDDPLAGTVVRIGLLPQWTVVGTSAPVDISGLGVEPIAFGSLGGKRWLNINTDDMVFGSGPQPEHQSTSSPALAGSANPLVHHLDDLTVGFAEAYEAMMTPTVADVVRRGIARFRGVRRRIVLRNTSVYVRIQREALSAAALRSATARGLELELLSRASLLSAEKPAVWDVFGAELTDMENLDVPYFDYPLGSVVIEGGGRSIDGVLDRDGLAEAAERVDGLCADDLAWQLRLIHGTFTSRFASSQGGPVETAEMVETVETVERAGYLSAEGLPSGGDAADAEPQRLWSRLEALSFPDRFGDPSWLTLSPTAGDSSTLSLGLTDGGLYAGRAGIAAFAHAVGQLGPDTPTAEWVRRVLAPVERSLLHTDEHTRLRFLRDGGLGISGVGGYLRSFEVLERGATQSGFDARGMSDVLINAITPALVAKDVQRDVVGGAAGAVGVIARRHLAEPSDSTTRALTLLAEHLMSAQLAESGGWLHQSKRVSLAGLGHGASGMGLALLEAGAALGRDDLIESGARGLEFEARLFDPAVGNWLDRRTGVAKGSFMTGWCSGAPGVGLARMRALQVVPSHPHADRWREQLDVAMHTTGAASDSQRDHLCCGNLGRAAVLGAVGAWAGNPEWVRLGRQITDRVAAAAAESGNYRFALSRGDAGTIGLHPGLLQGLSGVGMHLMAPGGNPDLVTLLV